jgi:hypothetical protein
MANIFTAYSPLLPDLSDDLAATYCRCSFVSSLASQASACQEK